MKEGQRIRSVIQKQSIIPLISEKDRQRVLDFTASSSSYPADSTLVQLFEEIVMMYPDKTALVCRQGSLSYDQLNSRSNRLAHRLKEEGVGQKTVVGLYLEKSIDLIVGILGILKSGGTYLPLDTEYPDERIQYMISDSGCSLILTQDKFKELASGAVRRMNLDSLSSYHIRDTNIEREGTAEDLAYIMYTSGTTGKPKGSMIRQKGVVRLVRNTNYIELTAEDRLLLTGAIVFDASTFEIWGSLLNGGSLNIPEKEEILDPNLLGNLLLKNGITTLWLTSSLFTRIAESRTDIFSRLRYLLVGGDVLSPPHINKVRRDNPGLKVINGYGPTENTTFTACYHIERDFEHNIPIGKPISNTTVYIFDKYLKLQPVGVIGELYTGGAGLSAGYINRDDLNRTKFIDNPYNPGEMLYRTGDLARWLADGNIEFHGRIDNQIKVRGFRVELEEIESLLSNIEGVLEAVVKTFKPKDGDLRLIAFLNVTETFGMGPGEISRILKGKMPSYMIPAVIKPMHGFPLTINGKIDRKELKYEAGEIRDNQVRDSVVFTPTEEKIYKIWCDVLKTNDILPDDNFFEIGGNSLLAISVLSKIISEFKLGISLRLLFNNPRLLDLAGYISKLDESNSDSGKQIWQNEARNMMSVNKAGSKTPLILIYCGNFSYFLSEWLGSDQPVYAFFDDGWLNGLKSDFDSVETLAKEYIYQLRKVLPQGPYILGGHSIGGVIAYEMSFQLKKSGQVVPLVTLFDSMSPYADRPGYSGINNKSIIKPVIKKLWQFIKIHLFDFFFMIRKSLPTIMRRTYIVMNYLLLFYKYRPEKSPGVLLLFKVNEDKLAYRDNYGWECLVDKVDSIVLDGDHLSIMQEKKYSKIIAEEVVKHLTHNENYRAE